VQGAQFVDGQAAVVVPVGPCKQKVAVGVELGGRDRAVAIGVQ